MKKEPLLQSKFDSFRCCVLIPTYNNYATLKRVLDGVREYTSNIIVINDGSTDQTDVILQQYDHLQVVNIPKNRGKGNALKTGFKKAEALGYDYAVSMDSDGQHFPDDLGVFIDALEAKSPGDPEILVIGSRKMNDPSVPQKSSFGNRCSSFWYWVETGIKLQDTQCGYRLYPLKIVNELELYTSRFELEIEVIVKAAWTGVNVKNSPVKVLYDPEERVTHFKPFQDVARITILNIWFVGVALFYILPRNIFRKIKKRAGGAARKEYSDTKLPLE